MARYIKANPRVAAFLHLEDTRTQLRDGNYILWQADMLEFGSLTQLSDILDRIGAISLSAHEAREEQDGTVLRPIPEATDPRFIYVPPVNSPEIDGNGPETDDYEKEGPDVSPETETPSGDPENDVEPEGADNESEGDDENGVAGDEQETKEDEEGEV